MYSWYLDAVSDHWSGVVNESYSTIFPVTYSIKLGVKQLGQALFTREFDIFGSEFNFHDVLPYLTPTFKNIQFRHSNKLDIPSVQRVHQIIDLSSDFESNYSTNAKRLIKKSNKNYSYKIVDCVDVIIYLINSFVAHKIKEFTPENIGKLKVLMRNALLVEKGEMISVMDGEEIVAAGFFLKDKSTITYLKGASTDEAKKSGAMFGMMNYALSGFKENYNTFDFGGSNIESVATFYKKFGASDRIYYEYTINNLPLWFKGLKKIRK